MTTNEENEMKKHVQVLRRSLEYSMENCWQGGVKIDTLVDGEMVKEMRFDDGEPEDNSLSRNFSDVCKITDNMKTIADLVGDSSFGSLDFIDEDDCGMADFDLTADEYMKNVYDYSDFD